MSSRNIHYRTPQIESFYRAHRTRWDQFYDSERVMLTRLKIEAHTAVLDIGCGCGGLGLALRERFGVIRYTGVEINPQAVESGSRLNPGARFLCGDLLTISREELAEASFDLVVSLGCIDWNVEFAGMLAKAYSYVRAGGHLLASFRLTTEASVVDVSRSFQYINFEGRREGEIAPYVVLNVGSLIKQLKSLAPARVSGYGYWGTPSSTAVTPFDRLGFAVLAIERPNHPVMDPPVELDLPAELLTAAV